MEEELFPLVLTPQKGIPLVQVPVNQIITDSIYIYDLIVVIMIMDHGIHVKKKNYHFIFIFIG